MDCLVSVCFLVHSIAAAQLDLEVSAKVGFVLSSIQSGSHAGLGQAQRLRIELGNCIHLLMHRALGEVRLNHDIGRRVSAA